MINKMNYQNNLKQDGFTLIEVLASIVLIFIILTTFFNFFSNSLLFSKKNEENLVAFNLASKTLKIIEGKYKNLLEQSELNLSCNDYPNGYPTELIAELEPSACYYMENQVNYFPEVSIKKQTSLDYSGLPILYIIHVQIFDSNSLAERKLLSETFGYIRGK